jgi:hypothetical protein
LEQAVELSRHVGAHLLVGVSGLSRVSLHARHGADGSLGAFRDVMEHWRSAGTLVHQWTTIRNLVEVLARRRADDAAARLYGAISSPDRGAAHGAEADRLTEAMRAVESRLGSTAFAALVAEGARLSDVDTVELALALVDEEAPS